MEYFNHEGWKGDIRSKLSDALQCRASHLIQDTEAMGMGNGCSDVRQSRQIFEYTIENANVLFSYLLGKEAGTYNGIDDTVCRTNSCQSSLTDKISHNNTVNSVVKLLKQISYKEWKCKQNQLLGNVSFGHKPGTGGMLLL